MRRKLIVVSNRGPASFGRDADGNRTATRGGGGLVTALRGLVSYHDVTWIASAITEEDRARLRELSRDLPRLWRAKTTKQEDPHQPHRQVENMHPDVDQRSAAAYPLAGERTP